MTTSPALMIFDWDNTLVHSWPLIHASINHTMTQMGHEPWSLERIRRNTKFSLRDTFPALFQERWEEARNHYATHYLSHHLEGIQPYEGLDSFLTALREAGVPLAVISNKTGPTLRKEAEHLAVAHHFIMLLGAGDCSADKPDPVVAETVCTHAGVQPGRDVWMLGDSVVDMELAERTGMTGCVLSPGGAPLGLEACTVAATFETFGDVLNALWAVPS